MTGAVDGIARACVEDPDDRLVALLTAAVSDTARFVGTSRAAEEVHAEAEALTATAHIIGPHLPLRLRARLAGARPRRRCWTRAPSAGSLTGAIRESRVG